MSKYSLFFQSVNKEISKNIKNIRSFFKNILLNFICNANCKEMKYRGLYQIKPKK